jgi:hypothetical protein
MSPFTYFVLIVVTVLGLVALDNIPLVTSLMASSPYSPTEVFSGLGSMLLVFYTVIFVLTGGK